MDLAREVFQVEGDKEKLMRVRDSVDAGVLTIQQSRQQSLRPEGAGGNDLEAASSSFASARVSKRRSTIVPAKKPGEDNSSSGDDDRGADDHLVSPAPPKPMTSRRAAFQAAAAAARAQARHEVPEGFLPPDGFSIAIAESDHHAGKANELSVKMGDKLFVRALPRESEWFMAVRVAAGVGSKVGRVPRTCVSMA